MLTKHVTVHEAFLDKSGSRRTNCKLSQEFLQCAVWLFALTNLQNSSGCNSDEDVTAINRLFVDVVELHAGDFREPHNSVSFIAVNRSAARILMPANSTFSDVLKEQS